MSALPPSLDRRLLLGAALCAAPGLAGPSRAQTGANRAEITFEIDEERLRALLGRRLREGLKRVFPDAFVGEILVDAAGVGLKLRRDDFAALAAALPQLDPGPRPARDPGEGLKLTKIGDAAARIDFGAATLDAQAVLWRARAANMLQKALAPRQTSVSDRDARRFVLTVAGMDRVQWARWIGGRIDLFFPSVFALAPLAAAGPNAWTPRLFPGSGLDPAVAVERAGVIGNEDDVFLARLEGAGPAERLVLDLTRAGAALFAAKNLPVADKAGYALLFDQAVAARAVLDGPAVEGRLRLRLDKGLGAAELADKIRLGGSAPMVRQVEARFG